MSKNPTVPHRDTYLVAHGSPTVMSCFFTELQGRTLKLQRRRDQASGNCKTFYLNCSWKFIHIHASPSDHKCELGLFTSISPCPVPASVACSVPPVPQHPATQREVYRPTSSTTHPASWKRATPSPSFPEKNPKHSTSSKKSNSSVLPCQKYWTMLQILCLLRVI